MDKMDELMSQIDFGDEPEITDITPVEAFIGDVKSLVISNDEELANADKLGKKANEYIKAVKDKYKEPKAEAQRVHKEIVANEKKELKQLEDAKAIIKKAVADYQNKRMLEAKKNKQEQEQSNVQEVPETSQNEQMKSTMVKLKWKWKVVDLNKVPRKYLVLNEKLLNDMAMYEKESAKVDGIEFYQEY